MNTIESLKEAIKSQKPISFEYNKEGKINGKRIGNIHAVFIFTAKSGKQSTKVDLVQTAGVSDTEQEKPLPSWRFFNIEDISNVIILHNEKEFIPDSEYKPEVPRYDNVIAKI